MKILVISQFFAPDVTAAAFRISETVTILQRAGHAVVVVTSEPHKAVIPGHADSSSVSDDVLRVRLLPVGKGGLWRYVLHYMSFSVGSIWQAIKLRKNGRWAPDVLWVTSPPLFSGLAGVFVSAFFRCPMVLDVRDIWPDSAVAAGQLRRNSLAYSLGKWMEKKLYSKASAITCVSRPMASYIEKNGGRAVHVIYNGVDALSKGRQRGFGAERRLVYAGNLGRVQGLEMLLDSFELLLSDKKYRGWSVVLIGAGANEKQLVARVSRSTTLKTNVHFLGPMKKDEVARYLAESAVLFLNLSDAEVFSLTIPSKVFDYMLAGRPIIFGIEGEGREILEASGANIYFRPSDGGRFLVALKNMIDGISTYESRAHRNRDKVLSDFKRDAQARRLEKILMGVAPKSL